MNVVLHPEHLNILSICTGGAGLDLGVELAIPSARSVCMVEREAFAVAQLVSAMEAGLLAPAPVWSDARTFNGRRWRGLVDGLIGGIPCQPHSLAGKRLGEEDERDLWSTTRRIIAQSGAWFVLIENVRGMLSSGGAERVWRDFHRMGFSIEGGLFTAAEVGASHERERLFILAVANTACFGRRKESDSGISSELAHKSRIGLVNTKSIRCSAWWSEHEGQPREPGAAEPSSSMVNTISSGRTRRQKVKIWGEERRASNERTGGQTLFPPRPNDIDGWRSALQSAPELEPAFCRVADGMASRMDLAQCWSRVDRLRMLGNGVVPLQAAYALRTLATRLAARGSGRAARLVRLMEGVHA